MLVACDFHNHTCLSPCGSLDLSPAVLARLARERGLGLVAITDHNSALNAPAFAECARREGIAALYGMEACTAEEVHILCLFSRTSDALEFGSYLETRLPAYPYDPETLGDQAVVDADDNVIDLPERYYGAALDLDYDGLCREAHSRGALVIPAHIDRPMFGVLAQLGFLPAGPYAAVESIRPLARGVADGYPRIRGSDAHYPEHVGRRPFGLELDAGWIDADGIVDLGSIAEALASGRIVLPDGP